MRQRRFSSYSDVDMEDDEYDMEDDDDDLESESDLEVDMMKCLSCEAEYENEDAGTCRQCYEDFGDTEKVLKRRIDKLETKVNFLRLFCAGSDIGNFSDVVLVALGASDSVDSRCSSLSIPAHRAVLISRSPVFRAMFNNEMEESLSGTIKIRDVSYDALRAFVEFLYTAEAYLDEDRACDLLVLAEKYQVEHLKTYCEEYLVSMLNWENSIPYYTFSKQHSANTLLDAALSLMVENMHKLCKREEYNELLLKDPRVIVRIILSLMEQDSENRCK